MKNSVKISTKVAKNICQIIGVLAAFLIVGIVGGIENDTMSFMQGIAFLVIDTATIVLSLVGYSFVDFVEYELKEEAKMRKKMRQERLKAIRERELRKGRFEEIKKSANIITLDNHRKIG